MVDRRDYFLLFIAGALIALDQYTKHLAATYLDVSPIVITQFFSLTYLENTGAGFGILEGLAFFLAVATVFIIAILIYFYMQERASFVPFGLLLGGAMGNLIDRLMHGYVIDFINFSFWPAFNVADSAITVGVVLLIYRMVVCSPKHVKNKEWRSKKE